MRRSSGLDCQSWHAVGLTDDWNVCGPRAPVALTGHRTALRIICRYDLRSPTPRWRRLSLITASRSVSIYSKTWTDKDTTRRE